MTDSELCKIATAKIVNDVYVGKDALSGMIARVDLIHSEAEQKIKSVNTAANRLAAAQSGQYYLPLYGLRSGLECSVLKKLMPQLKNLESPNIPLIFGQHHDVCSVSATWADENSLTFDNISKMTSPEQYVSDSTGLMHW